MRKSVVWIGIVMVIAGSMILLIGYVLDYNAWDTIITGIEEDNESIWLQGYEQSKNAELVVAIGFLIAFVGIGIGFAGMTVEPPRPVMEGYPPPP
ncbi:MAG: hypothetical protein KAW84_06240 [Thermoplasmata archaeon]|nr:hypothetical protein [Thermoplasmata archaeon]